MPRKPNPNLERTIIDAALRLLQEKGIEAVTMREVARAAGTTTPTIYERFKDRDHLIDALTDFHRDRLLETLDPDDALERSASKFFTYCRDNPNIIDLLLKRIAGNLKAKKRGPMYEMVRINLMKQNGLDPREAEHVTMATSSMIFGTAMLMNQLGCSSTVAADLERSTLRLMRRLVVSYKK